jgi:hypothetical protein
MSDKRALWPIGKFDARSEVVVYRTSLPSYAPFPVYRPRPHSGASRVGKEEDSRSLRSVAEKVSTPTIQSIRNRIAEVSASQSS